MKKQPKGELIADYVMPRQGNISDLLNALGMDSSYQNRKVIAEKLKIPNYTGSAKQNIAMFNMLNGTVSDSMPQSYVKSVKKAPSANEEVIKHYADQMVASGNPRIFLTDKGTKMTYYGNASDYKGDINNLKKMEVLTGVNDNPYDTKYNKMSPKSIDNSSNPDKYKLTPVGKYKTAYNEDIYGYPGFNIEGTNAAYHTIYPGEFKERFAKYNNETTDDNNVSYGCINCYKPDLQGLIKNVKGGDSTYIIDSRLPIDQLDPAMNANSKVKPVQKVPVKAKKEPSFTQKVVDKVSDFFGNIFEDGGMILPYKMTSLNEQQFSDYYRYMGLHNSENQRLAESNPNLINLNKREKSIQPVWNNNEMNSPYQENMRLQRAYLRGDNMNGVDEELEYIKKMSYGGYAENGYSDFYSQLQQQQQFQIPMMQVPQTQPPSLQNYGANLETKTDPTQTPTGNYSENKNELRPGAFSGNTSGFNWTTQDNKVASPMTTSKEFDPYNVKMDPNQMSSTEKNTEVAEKVATNPMAGGGMGKMDPLAITSAAGKATLGVVDTFAAMGDKDKPFNAAMTGGSSAVKTADKILAPLDAIPGAKMFTAPVKALSFGIGAIVSAMRKKIENTEEGKGKDLRDYYDRNLQAVTAGRGTAKYGVSVSSVPLEKEIHADFDNYIKNGK